MAIAEYRAVVPAEHRLTRRLGPHAQLVILHLRCLRFSTPTGLGTFEADVLAIDCGLTHEQLGDALAECARKTDFSYTIDRNDLGAYWIPWVLEHDPPLPFESNYLGHERKLLAQPDTKEKARAVSAWNAWREKTPAKPGSMGGRTPAIAPTPTPTPTPTPPVVADAPPPAAEQTGFALKQEKAKTETEAKPMNATFAKAFKVAALWNEIMQDQPQGKAEPKNLRVLASALDLHGEDGLRALLTWAHSRDWHSGRKGSKPIGVWMARDALAVVAKDFENATRGSTGDWKPHSNEPFYERL